FHEMIAVFFLDRCFLVLLFFFFFSSRRRHTRSKRDRSSDVCSSDLAITYHRPAVNKRKIWGGLVPYGVMWRAGANENTTISFSTAVKVEGQTLPVGTYGLFMIPSESQWTVVFSKFTGDWGTYNYDPSEDAARVTVTPQTTTENQERMAFTFDDL